MNVFLRVMLVAACLWVLGPLGVFGQEAANAGTETKPSPSRKFNSTEDGGWYFINAGLVRYNPSFGAYYQGRLVHRLPLFREQNSFWFADSALVTGIEQDVGMFSRTSAYLFFQPVIAMSVELKVGYETAIAPELRPVKVDGPMDRFNFALPPFTGLNPKDRKPEYIGRDAFVVEFTPTATFGGKLGPGMIALIYSPTLMYIRAIGLADDQYYFYGRDVAVLRSSDILWKHSIRLGYAITGTGWSVAATGLVEQVQSSSRLMRAGIFASVAYEKPLESIPQLIPFVRMQMGTWLVEDYEANKFAIQLHTGLSWKFI